MSLVVGWTVMSAVLWIPHFSLSLSLSLSSVSVDYLKCCLLLIFVCEVETSGECQTRFYKRRVDKQKYGTIGADTDQRSLGPFKVSRRQFALLTFTGRISVQVLEQNSTREARYKYWYDECEILVRSTWLEAWLFSSFSFTFWHKSTQSYVTEEGGSLTSDLATRLASTGRLTLIRLIVFQ